MFCEGKKTKIRFLHLQINKVAELVDAYGLGGCCNVKQRK